MSSQSVLDKERTLLPSQDYYSLRESGMQYIQQLSGSLWTDHNLHDPGVTVLEILCYALTDLGYRTDFEVRDLLTKADGALDPSNLSGLFPAHEVLPNSPLTILDYRRLLLKIEGIRNAWMDPMSDPSQVGNYKKSEIPIYIDCLTEDLSYESINALGEENPRLRLSGLYKVLLELEIDDVLGSLNETGLVYQVKRGPLKGVVLSLDSEELAFQEGKLDFSATFQAVEDVVSIVQTQESYTAEVRISTADDPSLMLEELRIRVIQDKPRADLLPVTISLTYLREMLRDDSLDGIISLFWEKQRRRQRSIASVACVLQANRNLCEDFYSIGTVKPERVRVCADIELKPDADMERVQARVFHAIEQYFNPLLNYYSLQELVDSGLCGDEIFNRPYFDPTFECGSARVFTKPGFLKTEELQNSELRKVIYVSDIINILMDFEEIISINNVMLRKIDSAGNPLSDSEKWCLPITTNHQPVLSIDQSKILFFKNEIPYRARPEEFQKTLDHLRAMARKAAYVDPNQVLGTRPGQYRHPEEFYSIQHDFPATYGIGTTGLPKHAETQRVAQARQLKAYLTFYDQLLADYLSQLANVRQFFSLDKTLGRTYFSQYLDEIAGVREIFFEDEFYIDKTYLQDDSNRTLLNEDEELFLKRRNRILDHLTARFAEQFTDYVLMMFSLQGDALKTGQEMIEDKIDFLQEYPIVSRERNKAFNYRPEDLTQIWDTDNVSGLQKRVSRLLGIFDYTRRDLACEAVFGELFSTRKMGIQYRVEIKNAEDQVLFKSVELFPDRDAAMNEAFKLYPSMRHENAFTIDAGGGVGHVFFELSAAGVSLRHDEFFDTEADAVGTIRAIIDRYDETLHTLSVCDDEGLYLIEHILLRPFTENDGLMDVCLGSGGQSCGDDDPYSFRIQAILPYWPDRFRNPDFRRFFEINLRQEMPAHIHVRICWISNGQMSELQEKYRAWLEAKAASPLVLMDLTTTQKELIELMERLHSIYPEAVLHDCIEGEDENPVQLNRTNLGIF